MIEFLDLKPRQEENNIESLIEKHTCFEEAGAEIAQEDSKLDPIGKVIVSAIRCIGLLFTFDEELSHQSRNRKIVNFFRNLSEDEYIMYLMHKNKKVRDWAKQEWERRYG